MPAYVCGSPYVCCALTMRIQEMGFHTTKPRVRSNGVSFGCLQAMCGRASHTLQRFPNYRVEFLMYIARVSARLRCHWIFFPSFKKSLCCGCCYVCDCTRITISSSIRVEFSLFLSVQSSSSSSSSFILKSLWHRGAGSTHTHKRNHLEIRVFGVGRNIDGKKCTLALAGIHFVHTTRLRIQIRSPEPVVQRPSRQSRQFHQTHTTCVFLPLCGKHFLRSTTEPTMSISKECSSKPEGRQSRRSAAHHDDVESWKNRQRSRQRRAPGTNEISRLVLSRATG